MGTPHRGSTVAWWETLVAKVIFPVELRRDLMSALEPDSSPFQTIAEGFRLRADNLKIFSYYERMKTEGFGGSALIVGKNSATLGFPGESMRPMERGMDGTKGSVGQKCIDPTACLRDLQMVFQARQTLWMACFWHRRGLAVGDWRFRKWEDPPLDIRRERCWRLCP